VSLRDVYEGKLGVGSREQGARAALLNDKLQSSNDKRMTKSELRDKPRSKEEHEERKEIFKQVDMI